MDPVTLEMAGEKARRAGYFRFGNELKAEARRIRALSQGTAAGPTVERASPRAVAHGLCSQLFGTLPGRCTDEDEPEDIHGMGCDVITNAIALDRGMLRGTAAGPGGEGEGLARRYAALLRAAAFLGTDEKSCGSCDRSVVRCDLMGFECFGRLARSALREGQEGKVPESLSVSGIAPTPDESEVQHGLCLEAKLAAERDLAATRSVLEGALEALERVAQDSCRLPPGGTDCRSPTPPSWCVHQEARAALSRIQQPAPAAGEPTGTVCDLSSTPHIANVLHICTNPRRAPTQKGSDRDE